jgi:hypothetical protein
MKSPAAFSFAMQRCEDYIHRPFALLIRDAEFAENINFSIAIDPG